MIVFTGDGFDYWVWSANSIQQPVTNPTVLQMIALLDAAADSEGHATLPGVGVRMIYSTDNSVAYDLNGSYVAS